MFTFRQFAVDDSHTAMKVGTDAVTLGAWAPVAGAGRVLDIGCGCGLLALMIAQRAPEASVTAVEIDAGAAADARLNFARSPWADRLTLVEDDIFDYSSRHDALFDLIVCNPPFFTEALRSPDQSRSSARHEGSLGVESLITLSARLLSPGGRLAFIAPAQRDADIDFMVCSARLNTHRLTHLRQRAERPVRRSLRLCGRDDRLCRRDDLVISQSGGYTPEYQSLTADFYL